MWRKGHSMKMNVISLSQEPGPGERLDVVRVGSGNMVSVDGIPRAMSPIKFAHCMRSSGVGNFASVSSSASTSCHALVSEPYLILSWALTTILTYVLS